MIRFTFIIMILISSAGCNVTEPGNDTTSVLRQSSGPKVVRDWVSAIVPPDSTIWTWGPGWAGTLGTGSLESSEVPVKAIGIDNVIAIDLFAGIAVAADNKGDIYFWGDYLVYSEPPGFDTIVVVPTIVSHLSEVKSIVIGIGQLFYFLRNNGSVWFVQHDHYNPTKKMIPSKIEGLDNAIQITESYALRSDGTLFDIINTIPNEVTPPPNRGGPIPNLSGNVHVENVWFRRTVILKNDRTVWAWGWNDFGQLGNGTFEDSEEPVRVGNLTDVVAISAHYDYNLALKEDGTVWFWGLENPTEKRGTSTPIQISNLKKVSAIYADYISLVMCEDGSYWSFNADTKIPEQILFE